MFVVISWHGSHIVQVSPGWVPTPWNSRQSLHSTPQFPVYISLWHFWSMPRFSPKHHTWQNTVSQVFFKWRGLAWRSFFVLSTVRSSRPESVFLHPPQLPDSWSHRLAGWFGSHMKTSPFCFLKNIHSHNKVLLHLTTKSVPKIFLSPTSVLLLRFASACGHLLPRPPPGGLDSVPLFVSPSFLPQHLKHHAAIHQLAKSHNKILTIRAEIFISFLHHCLSTSNNVNHILSSW